MIEILYQDRNIAVCVKPAGLLSQAGPAGQPSMVSALSEQLGGEIFPVHRLDREVGGVMVYARSKTAAAWLTRLLPQISKEYLAAIHGRPSEDSALWTDLLYHDQKRNKTYVVKRDRKGVREARLIYRVMAQQSGQSLVQIRLLTGRTHQIRAQFSSRGFPLIGDGRYGGGSGQIQLWSLSLSLPFQDGEIRRFTSLPASLGDFDALTLPEPLDPNNFRI